MHVPAAHRFAHIADDIENESDFMLHSRRQFLQRSAGAATILGSDYLLPSFLSESLRGAQPDSEGRILIIVQLSGGNDGLNMVVPYEDDLYHRLRPSLSQKASTVHPLQDGLGLHSDMRAMKDIWERGELQVVSNVGYPTPDRSHFRSMDIWHTASLDPELAQSGWLGRAVDGWDQRASADGRDAATPKALHLDSGPLPLALHARKRTVPSITSMESFQLDGDVDRLASIIAAERKQGSDDLLYVQRTALAACTNAQRIANVVEQGQTRPAYPNFGLAKRLKEIASLIAADFGPRIYYTSLGGFDTHARQALAHGPLLRELSESVAAIQSDLKRDNLDQKVLLMTFSEFGRRVKENGSRGTDHGAAAPMLLVGPAAKGGISGGTPDLANLLEGDIRHSCDFREVYATVLRDWLGVEPAPILGDARPMDGLLRS